jgi:GNAT superfamily N-acetyltransferase
VPDFTSPVPLSDEHELDAFDCGSDAQSEWLRRYARQAQAAGTSRIYVATRPGPLAVVGYYALAAGSVEPADAPDRLLKGAGRYPVPVVLMARLGVDRTAQGLGLGQSLVIDALSRIVQAADVIGVRALLVHAESEEARQFYLHLAEFESSPTDPLHLMLLMKDLRAALSAI